MKKIFALCAAVLMSAVFASTTLFAQTAADATVENTGSYSDRSIQEIEVEDKYSDLHPTATNVKITLAYTPLTGEVRLYYSCLSSSFDTGEAMNTAMGVFQDFAQEHGYKHYYYKAKDKTKIRKDPDTKLRMAYYNSYVYFTK